MFSRILITTFYLILSVAPARAQDYVYADDQYGPVAGLGWILVLLQNVLTIALQLIGVAAFVMLAIGAFRMVTSAGDPKGAEAAKKTMTMAIAGLALAASAFLIFQLLSDVLGIESLLNVSIPTLEGELTQ